MGEPSSSWQNFNFRDDEGSAQGMQALRLLLAKLQEAEANPRLKPSVNNLLMTEDLMLTSTQRLPSSVAPMHLEGGEEVPVMHGPMQANVVPHPLQGPLQTDGAKKKQYHGQERHVGKIREEGDFHDDDDEPPSRSHHKKRTNERRTKRSRRNSSGGSSSSSQSGRSSHGRFPKKGCVLGKMHRFAFSQDGSVRGTQKLQLVHSDVCGPTRMPSMGNSLYFVTFIDEFARFFWVYPLKAKSDVFAIFQHYVAMVENETGCKVQTLCTDRGGENMSNAFKDFLGKKGIKHQCTMPYTPQQNGVAERKNKSLMEMARCMLKAKSLPHKLWMEAIAYAAHLLNKCPTRALKTITPYESWYDQKPSVSYLLVFGCLAYAHIPQQFRGKLDDKAIKCIFVGYSSGSKGYRLYKPATNKIFESCDVIFAETTA
ncbi:hypothetical protein L7F22_004839 [Adiantum nelumboides]|nr:hypothetical protein [Adiantum nelumboides]